MKTLATLLAALSLATNLSAQTKVFTDPANLGGERVKPRDGRELPVDQGALGLQQLLRRLKTRASIMNIVAHPDDEDGGMMTLYSRGMGARVADLSLTRGEGGQNAMTADFEDALGLLRTQELLSCDRYSGVDQFFGTEVDFGFSKTKEEAFAKWTHDRVLYDVVRAIRIYRPLVLTSTWVGGVTDGHGQHQASGEIAQEAFNKAGDPKVFPEMIAEGILPWQPLKVYARVAAQSITPQGLFDYATGQYTPARFENYVTGEVTATPPSVDVVVHEGDTDPLLADESGKPRSYVQFARMGLAQQKSQVGPGGRMPGAGKFDVSYHRYGSMLPKEKQKAQEESFFDGIDTSLEGFAELAPEAFPTDTMNYVSRAVHAASEKLDPAHPEAVAPILSSAIENLDVTIQSVEIWKGDSLKKASALHELRIKRVQLNDALALSLGLRLQAVATPATADASKIPVESLVHPGPLSALPGKLHLVPQEAADIVSELTGDVAAVQQIRSTIQLNDRAVLCNGCGDVLPREGQPVTARISDGFITRRDTPVTRPYFTRTSIEQPTYDLLEPALRNAAQTPPPITVTRELRYHDTPFTIAAVVESNPAPDEGQLTGQPVSIVPPMSVMLSSHAQVLPTPWSSSTTQFQVFLQSSETLTIHDVPPSPTLKVEAPAGWLASPMPTPKMLPKPGMPAEYAFSVSDPSGHRSPAMLRVTASWRGLPPSSEGFRTIGYGDLPRTNYYTPAETRIVPVDLKLPATRKIGYLPGTGDAVPEALASIGMKPEMLTVADLTADKLKQYDTVVLGVRTYAAHPDLHGAPTQALLNYAKSGGNVVVQYQTAEFTGDDAPYPLALAHYAGTVVDETAPVRLIEEPDDPAQQLLVTPNRIHPEDFNGWVEERGHGFLQTWDSHYSAPTETHDPGQDPQRGGLATVKLGEGRWTYLAFAVYRQLPEAVPGAFRLFVNLLQR